MEAGEKIRVNAKLIWLKTQEKFAAIRGDDIRKQAASCEYWALYNWVRKQDGHLESASGPGSTVEATDGTRDFIEKVIQEYEVSSIIDIGCGDWNWMSRVNLSGATYIGYDLVSETVANNIKLYGNRAGVEFKEANAILLEPAGVDLVIIRDVLFHLSNDHITRVLDNVRNSGSRYLMTTTFPQDVENKPLEPYGDNLTGWGYHRINVELPPFSLPKPIERVAELEQDREVRLYSIKV